MHSISVLVTSAGVASAVNIIKSLRLQKELDVSITATDADKSAPGLYLADYSYKSPLIHDFDQYLQFLIDTCKKHDVKALYPCYSEELSLISSVKEAFEAIGVKTLLASPETINLCNDKIKMSEFASGLGIKVPKIYTNTDTDIGKILNPVFPLFAKRMQGSSSIGAAKIDNHRDLDYFLNKYSNLFVQEFIDGQEVTIDIFCNRASEPIVIAPRLRLATKAGQSVKGKTTDNLSFQEDIKKLCNSVKMVGACNVQYIMNESKSIFIEINPRYAAGGLMLTVHAGANIPFLALKEMLGYKINGDECTVKPNVYMSRYWEEVFWEEEDEKILESKGEL